MMAIRSSVAGFLFVAAAWAQWPTVLSFTELKSLEGLWSAHPDDVELATRLGTNYAVDALGITGFASNGLIIGTATTESELALQSYARQALSVSRSGNVLGAAGGGMFIYSATLRTKSDGRDLAASLIDRAIELQPAEAKWRWQRIQMTISRERFPFWKPISSAEAYLMVLPDLNALSDESREAVLPGIAMLAFRANKLEDAERFARELLTGSDRSGNAVFKGNTVLGLIQVKHGDLEEAKESLWKAGAVSGSPSLNSFGPNMTLAAALLEVGERDSVLKYFEQCRRFWKMDQGKLNQWSADVRTGKKPKFDANLLY